MCVDYPEKIEVYLSGFGSLLLINIIWVEGMASMQYIIVNIIFFFREPPRLIKLVCFTERSHADIMSWYVPTTDLNSASGQVTYGSLFVV